MEAKRKIFSLEHLHHYNIREVYGGTCNIFKDINSYILYSPLGIKGVVLHMYPQYQRRHRCIAGLLKMNIEFILLLYSVFLTSVSIKKCKLKIAFIKIQMKHRNPKPNIYQSYYTIQIAKLWQVKKKIDYQLGIHLNQRPKSIFNSLN